MRHVMSLMAVLVGLSPIGLQAQRSTAAVATLTGTVVDSAGKAIPRLAVCYTAPFRNCADVGPLGRYSLADIPSGIQTVEVTCRLPRGTFYHVLAHAQVAFEAEATVTRDWRVVAKPDCEGRPLREVRGRFRGSLSLGFEESTFKPCPDAAWFIASDSLDTEPRDARYAWLTFGAEAYARLAWPANDRLGNRRDYYVEFDGVVTGPGAYGHLGVAPFEARVDSVIALRWSTPDDCR